MGKDIRVVYVATGEKYFNMFLTSVESLRKFEPTCEVFLFTNIEYSLPKNLNVNVYVLSEFEGNWYDKYVGIFFKTDCDIIYLDCDTLIVKPFVEDFVNGLKNYDILIRGGMGFNLDLEHQIAPKVLSQFNTGVIALKNEILDDLNTSLIKWRKKFTSYHQSTNLTDQTSFRMAVFELDLRICLLSADYNFQNRDFITHQVAILHFAANHYLMFDTKKLECLYRNLKNSKPGDLWVDWLPLIDSKIKVYNFVEILKTHSIKKLKIFLYQFRIFQKIN